MTNDLAGVRRSKLPRSACTIALLVAGLALAGCESSSSVFGTTGSTAPETTVAQQAAPAPRQSRVSVAPVIGAPDAIAKQLAQDFSQAITQAKVTVVPAQEKADYTLRGYIVAAKDKSATKISYIWDVTDPVGKRVDRITGEEIVNGTKTSDPWAGVSPQVTQSIAQKAATSLATWLSQQTPGPAPAPAVASAAPVAATSVGALPPAATAPTPAAPRMAAAAPPPAAPAPAASTGPVAAVIPSLTGASGDGNNALAKALQAEMTKNGVGNASQGGQPYRVEGVVKMGAANEGKQSVQIDWNVKDPQGKRLGTVTQKNEIAAGSLDSTWGQTADAAATAAAQGILKLLPRATASN